MLDIVITLVFSVVMLMFMVFPAMKTTQWIGKRVDLSQRKQNIITLAITLSLSLSVGLFLKFF